MGGMNTPGDLLNAALKALSQPPPPPAPANPLSPDAIKSLGFRSPAPAPNVPAPDLGPAPGTGAPQPDPNAPATPSAPSASPPQPGAAGFGPAAQPAQPETKAHKLMTILQGGLQGAMAGRAASENAVAQSGGRRSVGAGAGFTAGYELPWQHAMQGQQLAQAQAQTELTKQQGTMINIPGLGPMPAGLAKALYPQLLKGQTAEKVQGMKGDTAETNTNTQVQGRQNVANTQAQSKMSVEQMKFAIQNGQISRVADGIDPSTGQPAKLSYNRTGQLIGVLPGSLPGKSYLPSSTDTIEYKEDADGNIRALPKHSTRQPMLPSGGGGTAPTGAPQGGGASVKPAGGGAGKVVMQGKIPAMVTGTSLDGRQIAGTPEEMRAAGALGVTKLEGADASKVYIARQLTSPGGLFDLANKDLAQFKPGELEGLAPRWNEFLAGKVGIGDPRYVALRTHVNGLLSTALMQAHVGSKGGEHIMEHFQNLADAGKFNKDSLTAALNAEKQYVDEKAMRPTTKAPATAPATGGLTASDMLKKYPPK